jgi:3-hydroxyacyl-CoA dehydrogenase/enoyl-CoA hydratase/3-hydroxybutyryl-CoA epimerase
VPAAKAWIRANPEAAQNPWDAPGYRMPGGTPSNPKLAAFLPAFPANLRKQLKGADYPAPRAIMCAAVEGAQVDFETASRIESRYLVQLATGANAQNMIQAFFFDLQAINAGSLRPEGFETFEPTKVGVLGAGMMGAGIAYACARSGLDVVLKDVALENAEKGKGYSVKLVEKAVSRGKMTEEKGRELLDRITPAEDPQDLAGCDLVIEAVFEDPSLKAKVFAEVLEVVDPGALLCSNTSDETVARAVDVVQRIRKTPIVVNDSRGFYTSRVIGTQINEGLAMLGEGVRPMSIERAATQAGYPVGPLQISDELNMELMVKIRNATKAAVERSGATYTPHPAERVIDTMIEIGRPSKLKGAGFYEYDEQGKRLGLWPGLADTFPPAAGTPAFDDIADLKDRFLFIEAIETARCFEEGVIESAAAANIGSIMGIGYPPNTGGAVQFMQGYEGGLAGFVARARELAASYGERFTPPAYLVDLAENGGSFPA